MEPNFFLRILNEVAGETTHVNRLFHPPMSADLIFQHFDRIAEAPDAIPRLRRFILDLAVRGKLVLQDPNDEPASDLVKRIEAEKVRLVKEGKIRKPKPLPAMDPEEVPFEVPEGWEWVRLGKIGRWAVGGGFPTTEQGEANGKYFFLKVSDMNLPGNEKFINFANNTIDDSAAKRMKSRIHPVGTIIFPKIGGAIATNKRRILARPSAIDNNCLGIIASKCMSSDWIYMLLSHIDFTQYQSGTATPALQQSTLVYPVINNETYGRGGCRISHETCDRNQIGRSHSRETRCDMPKSACISTTCGASEDCSVVGSGAREY